MNLIKPTVNPSLENRLQVRERPKYQHVMFQSWKNLLFLHWEFPVEEIQSTLPEGLYVDTYEGKAYLGVVPFFMHNVRPRFLPPIPWLSNFQELNLRTYVHDRNGIPGVWFYSLEANQPLAVEIARRFFHLPYQHARMHFRNELGVIDYRSSRIGNAYKDLTTSFVYEPSEPLDTATPESLEFFLVERYILFALSRSKLWSGAVHHKPYPLRKAKVRRADENLLILNQFKPTGRAPDHVLMSEGVQVMIYPLRRIQSN